MFLRRAATVTFPAIASGSSRHGRSICVQTFQTNAFVLRASPHLLHSRQFSKKKKGKKKNEPAAEKTEVEQTADAPTEDLFDFTKATAKLDKIVASYEETLKGFRAGRTDPAMLDKIKVDAYGDKSPLSNVAQVSLQSPKLLLVNVFDPALVGPVEKAIRTANLNLNPAVEGGAIKVPVPKTTKESREETAKLAAGSREEAKKRVSQIRRDVVKKLKNRKGEAGVSDDDIFKAQEQFDAIVEQVNDGILKRFKKREGEILQG